MWIAGKLTQNAAPPLKAEQGTVTIGGREAGVLAGSETRQIPLVQPCGFAWRPKAGRQVLILKDADGDTYLLGEVASSSAAPDDLEDGEVRLFSDGASICLRRNGRIDIRGSVFVNGTELQQQI